MRESIDLIFALSQDIRYVAIYLGGRLFSFSKPGTAGASSSESDKYEELIFEAYCVRAVCCNQFCPALELLYPSLI